MIVRDREVQIRYGRIGDKGQTTLSQFPTAEKARAEAQKKINEKIKKGYERAVQGVRKKRAVTRREVASAPSTAKAAPVVWNFHSGARAFGIFIDEQRCWVGNQDGKVFAVDPAGKVLTSFKLPEGVKCIIADGPWLYAGCDDGKVYDLSGKVPRVAYEIDDSVDIFWLDIHDGVLAVSDSGGQVTVVNHEDESQWSKRSGGQHGWMVRCDEIGVYHGHSTGVTMYDWEDGKKIWERPTDGGILFGWQEESVIFASTSANKIFCFTKKGERGTVYACDAPVFSCAAAEDGRYVFVGDNCSSIYCFDQQGKRLWKLGTGCGSALSMQFLKDRVYVVTTGGNLLCMDASEAAIQAAQQGVVPKAVSIQAPAQVQAADPRALETVRAATAGQGVIAECYQEGGKLRVRIVSPGYNRDWHCQFPKDIREAGARYLVDEVRESARGGFYRVLGNIRRLAA